MKLFLNDKLGEITLESDEASDEGAILLLAHGAGAGMHHPFMTSLSKEISMKGVSVVRFNFPYVEKGRKAPGSPKDAIEAWRCVIQEIRNRNPKTALFISGKSYGGRMASHLLAESDSTNIKGIIYFGFPLHAPGKDSDERAAHLGTIAIPQFFIQGTRDKLANLSLISSVVAKLPLATLEEIELGDHSFKVPKSTGFSPEQMIEHLAGITSEWMKKLLI